MQPFLDVSNDEDSLELDGDGRWPFRSFFLSNSSLICLIQVSEFLPLLSFCFRLGEGHKMQIFHQGHYASYSCYFFSFSNDNLGGSPR